MILPGHVDSRVAAGFDRLAPVYDLAARAFPGDALRRTAESLLDRMPRGAAVLVVGGGSGRILPALLGRDPAHVVWLDASRGMTIRARRRVAGDPRVEFRVGGLERLAANDTFDVIVTPFFLDLYDGVRQEAVVRSLATRLRPAGAWIDADFVPGRARLLVGALYLAFRVACAVEARRLSDPEAAFRRAGFVPNAERSFLRGTLRATCRVRDGGPTTANRVPGGGTSVPTTSRGDRARPAVHPRRTRS